MTLPSAERMTQLSFRSPSTYGPSSTCPLREANDPVAVLLAVDKGAFLDDPGREADDPVAVLLAVDKGAFLDLPVREAG